METYLCFVFVERIVLRAEGPTADHHVANTPFECFPVFNGVKELMCELLHLHRIQVGEEAHRVLTNEPYHKLFVVWQLVLVAVRATDRLCDLLLVYYRNELLKNLDLQLEACQVSAVGHEADEFLHNLNVEPHKEFCANCWMTAHFANQILKAL